MVVAGIITGNKGKELAMSDITKDYLIKFWELIDEILNALLFLLIGLEMIVLSFNSPVIWAGCIAILVVLLARLISVFLPTFILSFRRSFERSLDSNSDLGWIEGRYFRCACSIPAKGRYRDILVSITYMIVVFSILVQGLTIGRLAKRLIPSDKII
jgi:CPA1 family monovalent cation:H+ antiporter